MLTAQSQKKVINLTKYMHCCKIMVFVECFMFIFCPILKLIALQIDGKIVTMKKVKEKQPDFLSKIEKSRPPSDHFDSEILDKIVSNENFMDKLREASKLMFNGESDDKIVIKDNSDRVEPHPPIVLVKNNDFLDKIQKLSKMEKLVSPVSFGDFFPSKKSESAKTNNGVSFLPIADPGKELNQKSGGAVFPQSESNNEVIFITEKPSAPLRIDAPQNRFNFHPVSSDGNQHVVSSQLIVGEGKVRLKTRFPSSRLNCFFQRLIL